MPAMMEKNQKILHKYTTQYVETQIECCNTEKKPKKHFHLPCITKAMQKYHLKQG